MMIDCAAGNAKVVACSFGNLKLRERSRSLSARASIACTRTCERNEIALWGNNGKKQRQNEFQKDNTVGLQTKRKSSAVNSAIASIAPE
jgi:hypothetical protein